MRKYTFADIIVDPKDPRLEKAMEEGKTIVCGTDLELLIKHMQDADRGYRLEEVRADSILNLPFHAEIGWDYPMSMIEEEEE